MKTRFKILLLGVILSFASLVCGSTDINDNRWISPDKTKAIHLIPRYTRPNNPPIIDLVTEVKGKAIPISESAVIASPIRREYAGNYWLEDVAPRWVDNRYAIFERDGTAEPALCIIDSENGAMLLNAVFESLVDAPAGDRWTAIRYRPQTRNQQRLQGGEADTLFMINLPHVAAAAKAMPAAEQKLFGHLKSSVLPGIALAHPFWNADASKILVGIWNWKTRQAEALSFDPVTMNLQGSVNMNLAVPDVVAYSPWINADFEPKVIEALNNSGL
jgi:hypothetical protein